MASTVWIVRYLWLIPALPILAAGIGALLKQRQRRFAATIAIALDELFLLCWRWLPLPISCSQPERLVLQFSVDAIRVEWVKLGWVLDPLAAVMLVMVTFVGLLIFIYSVAYMHHDENFTRFFCFLSLFAGAMLGLLIANSLLLLFMCWEVVGLTSYLLIGFWYERPAAAAAAKKAFITTRIGDLGLLLGMVWLYGQTGTLLFYDHGAGCMEHTALSLLATQMVGFGMAASTGIALLIFCGAVGKSGQLPLHVWLPDAMEGPTPVSALIHAATMVAAGVYLVARVYPLMSASSSAAHRRSARGGHLGWRSDCNLCRARGRGAGRYQTHSGLLDRLAARLHDDGHRRGRGGGRHLSPYCPCIFQSAAVSRRGIGDPRLNGRAGHSRDGRHPQMDAVDVCNLRGGDAGIMRVPFILLRLLEQGCDSACCLRVERLTGALLSGRDRGAAYGLLHDAPGLLRLLRRQAQGSSAGTD